MLLPGTEIHIFVFLILIFESVFLLFQVLHFLARPSDKKRFWFLLLLLFTVYYNAVSGFLPDTKINISIEVQNIVAYSGGLFVSIYLPIYIYKTFNLTRLKTYAYWGSAIFLGMPFFMCFLMPYYLTGDLTLSRKLVVVVPFLYAISFIFSLSVSIYTEYNKLIHAFSKIEILSIYAAVIIWTALPIIVYFDGSQFIENTVVNTGILLFIIIKVRKNIKQSKEEYKLLQLTQTVLTNTESKNAFEEMCIAFNITPREKEIIQLIAKNYAYKQIGEELFISDKTVSKHVSNIYAKVGVAQRSDLIEKMKCELAAA